MDLLKKIDMFVGYKVDELIKEEEERNINELTDNELKKILTKQFGAKNWRMEKNGEVHVYDTKPHTNIKGWYHYGDKTDDNLIKLKTPSSRLSGGYE